jgi:hypothetical protein
VLAPGAPRGLPILGERRPGLEADRDRPQHVTERLRHDRRDAEQDRGGKVAARGAPAQRGAMVIAGPLGAREQQPDRHGCDAGRHARGEEQQPLRGPIGAVAVTEDREADPGPPQAKNSPRAIQTLRISGSSTTRLAS